MARLDFQRAGWYPGSGDRLRGDRGGGGEKGGRLAWAGEFIAGDNTETF